MDVSNIPGLCYLVEDNRYLIKSPAILPRKLDDIPFPAYDLLDMDFYTLEVNLDKWIWLLKKFP